MADAALQALVQPHALPTSAAPPLCQQAKYFFFEQNSVLAHQHSMASRTPVP
jgi:hypothetical protein